MKCFTNCVFLFNESSPPTTTCGVQNNQVLKISYISFTKVDMVTRNLTLEYPSLSCFSRSKLNEISFGYYASCGLYGIACIGIPSSLQMKLFSNEYGFTIMSILKILVWAFQTKARSHALIYTRYVNYTYIFNLHPGVLNFFATRSHAFKIFWTKPCINPIVWDGDWFLSETEVWTHVLHAFWTKGILFKYCVVTIWCICALL